MGNKNQYSSSSNLVVNDSKRTYIVPQWTRKDQGRQIIMQLFHGTTLSAAASIKLSGQILPSKQGRIGPGIYFCDQAETAIKIGTYRSLQKGIPGCAYVKCKVKVREKFFRYGRHPKWSEVCESFDQFCIQKGQIQIIQILIIGMINSELGIAALINV